MKIVCAYYWISLAGTWRLEALLGSLGTVCSSAYEAVLFKTAFVLAFLGAWALKHLDGSALSRFQFGSVFKKSLLAAGFPSQDYSSHSFRIGATTEVARWVLEDRLVHQLGRWESQSFKLYRRPHLL